MVYSEEQPVNVTSDPVARDYEHLAMECAHRTFTVRNRIAVIGGSNARGLAHCLGKDAQFVEADTSEVIAARAAKLFPSRMIRLIIIWPQQQQHPLGLWEVVRRSAQKLLEFNQLRVLLLAPATKLTQDLSYATMLRIWTTPPRPHSTRSELTLSPTSRTIRSVRSSATSTFDRHASREWHASARSTSRTPSV